MRIVPETKFDIYIFITLSKHFIRVNVLLGNIIRKNWVYFVIVRF